LTVAFKSILSAETNLHLITVPWALERG